MREGTREASRPGRTVSTDPVPRVAPGRTTQRESGDGAKAVARGPNKGSVFSAFRAPQELLHGNPAELTDAAGNATTEHRAMMMEDVANHAGVPSPGVTTLGAEPDTFVRMLRKSDNPLETVPPRTPAAGELFWVRPQGEVAQVGDAPITGFYGTVDAPNVHERATPGIYVGDGPSPDDVFQGNLGDCYFLSTLMSVAQRDPGKIKSIIQPDGRGGATVTLWRRNDHNANPLERLLPALDRKFDYAPVDVHVSAELVADINGWLRGAKPHAGQTPISMDWWVNAANFQLEVHRRDLYEVARWVPLMEKAYARIAQTYGQFATERGQSSSRSGYDVIGNGGWPISVLTTLYGPDERVEASGMSVAKTTWSPFEGTGTALLRANQQVIEHLARVAARGHEPTHEPDAPIVTAFSMESDMVVRVGPAVRAAINDPAFNTIGPEHQLALRKVLDAWSQWNRTPADRPGTRARLDAYEAIRLACGAAAINGVAPRVGGSMVGGWEKESRRSANQLHASPSPAIQAAVDLMLDVRNVTDDPSPQQRNVTTDHAYSVVGAWFVDSAWQSVPLHATSDAERAELFSRVDTQLSSVRVRNPHHENEPDRLGNEQPSRRDDGAPDGAASDGMFTLSLEQFLRNFSGVGSGVFQRQQ